MNRFKTAALLVAALVAGLGSNALAAPGDAPEGWSLVGSDTVRYFVPGSTPPAGADLADAGSATKITSTAPSSGEWLQVSSENVRDFLPDGAESSSDQLVSSTFVSSRNEQQVYSGGRQKLSGDPTYDSPVYETDSKKWRLTSQTATVRRYDVPVYQNVHTPYRIVDRYGYDTRTVDTYDNTYRVNKTVKTALGQELVDTHTYTKREDKASAWARGAIAPSLDKLVSTGVDDSTRTTYQAYVVDLLSGKVAESDKSLGAKSSTYLSDSGAGNNKTALSGSQKRVTFKADEAVASLSKKAEEGGSIKDPTSAKDKEAKEAEKAAGKVAKEAEKAAEKAAKEAEKAAEQDSSNQAFALSDWVGTFEKSDQRVVISQSGTSPFATLYKKQGNAWNRVAQDTSPPSGRLNSNRSTYNDPYGPSFYTGGDVTLKRKHSGDLELSGTYKGSWGSFSFDKLKKQ